jgi:DNA-binding Lrp family transcriptional regulator
VEEILDILERDGRATAEKISTLTGTSRQSVEEMIKHAEEEKIILRYKAVINWEKAGKEKVWALIEVRVKPEENTGFDAVARRISRFPSIHSVYLVSGAYDLLVVAKGKSMQDVSSFVAQKLSCLPSVLRTTTHFILKRYKDDGEMLDGGEEERRLPLSL